MATGIGSVPFSDIQDTCKNIFNNLHDIPFWPQFVKRSHLEDMNIQFSEGLPLLVIEKEKRSLAVSNEDTAAGLVEFYNRFLAEDVDYFAISRDYAPGLYSLVDMIRKNPEKTGPYIKGQTVGPVTFASSINDHTGKSVLYNPELLEAMVKGLSIKALWQINKLSETGKKPILFIDEPSLSGFGSAFSSIQRHEVIHLLKEIINYVKKHSDALIGIHCCGNTDWPMIMESGPDIINFDAFDYMDSFLLYPEEIMKFINNGGIIAWGIVPTFVFTGKETVEGLLSRLEEGLTQLYEWGLKKEIIRANSMLTPACGMGTMKEGSSRTVLDMLSMLSEKMRKREFP